MLLTLYLQKHRMPIFASMLLASILVVTFCAPLIAVAAENTLSEVRLSAMDPDQVAFGKTAGVSLSFQNLPEDAMPALQPAGPFATHFQPLDQPAIALAKHQDIVFAADGKAIHSLDFSQSYPQILGFTLLSNPVTSLQVDDDHLYAATNAGQVVVYHIGPGDRLELLHTLSVDAPVNALAVTDGKAYVLAGHQKLLVFSLATSGKGPQKQAELQLPSRFNALYASGTRVYLSGDEMGVQIVDVSNPSKPQIHPGFRLSGQGQDITVDGNLAFVAGGASGVTVFDVSDPDHIQWLGSHNKMGAVYNVAVYQGIIAVVNNAGERLVSLDVSNPQLPITDSIFKTHGRIHDLLVDWPYVYVAGSDGVERVDFSSSAAIQISNEGINQGGSRRAFIRDNIAYVADWFSGLHMYDISIPNAPRHLGNFHTPGSSKGVVVRDNIAFVGDDDHGLQIIDISDPQHPRKISEVMSKGLAYTMKLVDNLIYLADHRGGFDIIDVSDIRKPKIIGSYDTPGKSWAIDVRDDIAYVADDTSGLLVFDVHDPDAIELIGQFDPGGYAEDVVIAGNQAYVAFFDKGFYILDISNPRQPQLTGHTPIPGNARSVTLDGPYAYIAGWESGLQVVDIRKLSAPKIVAYYDTDGSAWGVDIYKNHAYVWDWWGGVKVIDISNPLHPRAAGRYHGKGLIRRLAIAGDFLYTANGAGGMQVYDIKNPLNPIWATGLDVSGAVLDVALAGDKAYLAAGDAGLAIADISDPFYTRWLGHLQTPGRIQRVVGEEHLLIVQDDRAGLLAVDVSKPEYPRIVSRLRVDCDEHCTDFRLHERRLYVTSKTKGLTVYRLDDHLQLHLVANHATEQPAHWVRVNGDHIVLSEAGRGIHLLQLQKHQVRHQGFFEYRGTIDDIQVYGKHLYVASGPVGILDIDISRPKNPRLSVVYPPTAILDNIAVNEHAIFVGGNKTINSVSRLEDVSLRRTAGGKFTLQLPSSLPLGRYQLSLLQPDGSKTVLQESLAVKPAKSKKPKFTMEDFKKILEQQKLNKPSPPP
jgi:hypothetical protein